MPVITISRQFGAGGKTLGKQVAKQLDYTFADNQIIQMVAETANVSPHWVESIEKEAGTRLNKIISRMVSRGLIDRVLKDERGYIDEEIYLDYVIVIISQIAEEGNVVILGRGSQYILNDHPDAHHILLIDDVENRVKFMMDNYDLSRKEAEKTISNEDRRRLNFYRKLGKKDYDDPALYHLVLNMNRLGMKEAVKTVCNLVNP
ncbi:MAG: cytidylate kinase-like family protein [Deltaproteobacteria bacterium]|nr:cytidylate kinase-like family protein [Deltaproteobacteria bacterium]